MTKKADQGAEIAPITRPYTIASGRTVTFAQPDLFDLASGKVELPNSAKLDIWSLLLRGGEDDPKQQLLSDEKYIRSLYYCAQLVATPRVKLDDEDEEGVVDRREWSLTDLLASFRFLRFGPPSPPQGGEFSSGEAAASAGGGLPSSAE